MSDTTICFLARNKFEWIFRYSKWRRKWQPTPVFLPGESHGQKSLEDYSPWDGERVRHDLVTKQLL